MAPTSTPGRRHRGLERVRAQLLAALHFGKLHPGDRAPSVRRLADLTGMNRKTVHRAYRSLAREGLLDLRPGSGTFIAEPRTGPAGQLVAGDLLVAVNRFRAEACRLRLSPDVLASFLGHYLGDGLRGLPLVVAECNREQLELIGDDLHAGLGVAPRPVLLSRLATNPEAALEGARAVVTTDCHQAEVSALVTPLKLPVYRVALDAGFPQLLIHHARQGPMIMVVRDRAFAPVFLRLVRQLSVEAEVVRRFVIVEPGEARFALQEAGGAGAVYVSPLVEDLMEGRIPATFRRVHARWHLDAGALERVRAALALDLATGGEPTPSRATA